MRKVFCIMTMLALMAGQAWAKLSTHPAAKPIPEQATLVSSETTASSLTPETKTLAPSYQVEEMTPGLSYNFLMDMKLFDLSNPIIAVATTAPDKFDWTMYSTYRAVVANVFNNGIALLADIEKPGYVSATYPALKVNELYAKYKEGKFSAKIGRQVVGDTSDLLVGFQNDAVMIGLDLAPVDLKIFIARPELYMPWQIAAPSMAGMFGVIPTFDLGKNMDLKAYLLVGTEQTIATPAGGDPKSVINSLITLGGKYAMEIPLSQGANVNWSAQLGLQTAMARDAVDASIDASGVGIKLDGGYSHTPANAFGFKINAHMVYTSGGDATGTATKYGFFSNNALVGSGPGLFGKIQGPAGTFSYLDSNSYTPKIQQYYGVFAGGATADFFINSFQLGTGLWGYGDTTKYPATPAQNPTMTGMEWDEWVTYRMSNTLSFYQQFAYFIPSGYSPAVTGATTRSPLKFLLGTTLAF